MQGASRANVTILRRFDIPMSEPTYEGWKNYATWNVMLWINNEYSYYKAAVEFMKDYKGNKPYLDFIEDCGLDTQRTPDKIMWKSKQLDYKSLNEAMREFKDG
jgi:hypothetical protein